MQRGRSKKARKYAAEARFLLLTAAMASSKAALKMGARFSPLALPSLAHRGDGVVVGRAEGRQEVGVLRDVGLGVEEEEEEEEDEEQAGDCQNV